MLLLLKALRRDDHGVILSTEIVIIGSLLVIGLITGLTCLQQSVDHELKDLAGAIGALDQSYSFSAHRKQGVAGQCCAWTAGSSYLNCETKSDRCIDIVGCTEPCTQNGCCSSAAVTGHNACASCGSCGATVEYGSGECGICGGSGRVSGGFSVDGYQSPRKARCVETGVPNLKITEWPLDCPTPEMVIPSNSHDSGVRIESQSPVLTVPHEPIIHDQAIHEHPMIEVPGTITPVTPIIEHGQVIEKVQPPTTVKPSEPTTPNVRPVPSNDPLPMPKPAANSTPPAT